MSRKYKFRNPDGIYFVTFAVVQWVDLLTRSHYNDFLIKNLEYCAANKQLNVHAFCLMTNHVHLILSRSGTPTLGEILRDYKKFTSNGLYNMMQDEKESRRHWMKLLFQNAGMNKSNNKNVQIWQQDNHPIELMSNKMIKQKLNYVHLNPVKAGFVSEPEHWVYSSASNYAGQGGVMDVVFLD